MRDTHSIDHHRHRHVYLGADHQRNEQRAWWVVGITAAMMVLEIAAGLAFGSMALLAVPLRLLSHACCSPYNVILCPRSYSHHFRQFRRALTPSLSARPLYHIEYPFDHTPVRGASQHFTHFRYHFIGITRVVGAFHFLRVFFDLPFA